MEGSYLSLEQKRSRRFSIPNNKKLSLLKFTALPIFDQLELEELLLRSSSQNICLINQGSSKAIVMGISGKTEELDIGKIKKDEIPVIRRFSGGGTVFVDENTLFVTFIISDGVDIPHFPEPILRWGEMIFQKSFSITDFKLTENDYTIGDFKCAGNAQYIQKGRFLLHTSFLWDYQSKNMDYLLLPQKRPAYRKSRPHTEFLCKLKDHFSSKESFIESIESTLRKEFEIDEISMKEIAWKHHRKTVQKIEL